MKIVAVFLITNVLNSPLIAANSTDTVVPAPEVIKCESKGTCKMTPLETLQILEKKR